MYLSYLINNIKESAIDSTITHIFFNYIKLAFNTQLSEAVDAGNKFAFSLDNKYFIINFRGIHLTIEAYSDVIENIFKEITDVILNSNVSESVFKEVIEITYNEFKEKENAAPYQKAFMIFNKIIERNSTHYTENLKVYSV